MTDLMDTYIENRHLVQPNHTNNYDVAHGGNVLKWMDVVGALSAMRCAEMTCVTARMEEVNFVQPIPRGESALIQAYAYETGRTSIRVRIKAYRENPQTGERELTTESHFVYVAIDDNLEPTPVPDLTLDTDEGAELQRRAQEDAKNMRNGDS
ncbi:Acyl-CoA hydrolase [Halogranum gelatinilyticum]|uniref:Acyl-CoA hydrolase n=1 Tax=Halogranum gelatinilyticum TaxID=660521 RepID=A0A1G9W4A2_9EURY|nr:acyl-CoA thioesterase [Halogranum gelatinilyticum]SDM78885.1 Acyl-CoA hydrolase [Halogranum gelatinilyticum]